MSEKRRIVFVNQEMAPYLTGTPACAAARDLAVGMHKRKYEVRTFMPRFGDVNERRNQLHEVIRLSGINIPIDDIDHPLIIKVASLQPARIQVYFIDNDDFFQQEASDADSTGSNRADNDERAIFFARGTAETVRKLKWNPHIIHCSGWITSLIPVILRGSYADDPSFKESRIVYTVRDSRVTGPVSTEMMRRLGEEEVPEEMLIPFETPEAPAGEDGSNPAVFDRLAVSYADAVIFETPEPDPVLMEIVKSRGIPFMTAEEASGPDAYHNFYSRL
ncbi:MAG: glycogen/starch synthase [Muribaculaceae bacterium]|nr:glycogen/starch synthase [Muribaculaceae bacterium]